MPNTKEPSTKKPNRSKVPFNIWIPPDLEAAFNEFLDSLEFRPTATDVGIQALKEFLAKRGFWPDA